MALFTCVRAPKVLFDSSVVPIAVNLVRFLNAPPNRRVMRDSVKARRLGSARLTLRGLKVPAGSFVQERDIICSQTSLKYHPGLNTGIDPRENVLYATCDGTLIVTTEKFNPNKDHELVQKSYSDLRGNLFKLYVHVIPPKDEVVFKLIDLV
ncbi:39S ribosomal protein L27-like protein [Dinothrombium tinctorium]|uniref:39S ribosomal protein L27-like protein n=1 Tax=Dinothrombium tinctorium TaxID=1965070 RepID=A0A443QJI5_9ACAR|nr:39S ribosomal protein L27-like protein [Dinothrombium tinctorium]